MKKGIAFFDFDGTITTKDTLLEFIQFTKGSLRFFTGFLLNSPYLIGYKFKLIPNQRAKEIILEYFFRNTPVEVFKELCENFSKQVLPKLIRSKAVEEINKLKKEGFIIVVVSASPENWICKWAGDMQVELIASQLEIKEGRLTGKILGKNCHGIEKVRRIREKYVVTDYDKIFVYGDTLADQPMLELATQPFYQPFK